jgi:hypothetical protein
MTTTESLASIIAESPRNTEMARQTLRWIGKDEGSMLVYTANAMTVTELAAALAKRDWKWADVLRQHT